MIKREYWVRTAMEGGRKHEKRGVSPLEEER
jgi:hypothetical protein